MIADGKREIGELAVVGDVRVDGEILTRTWAKVVEQLCDTLVAVGIFAERVDDPDLPGSDSGGECSGLGITRNKFNVLDTLSIRDGDCRDYLA